MQKIIPWNVPVQADWARSAELDSITLNGHGLVLKILEEQTQKIWELDFKQIQAFRCTTEECAKYLDLPGNGGFFEVQNSQWIQDLGYGYIKFLEKSRHFIVSCYDEVIEVVAWDYEFA